MATIPRPLLRKHLELAHELQAVEGRVAEVREQLQTIVSAIRLLDPRWQPPKVGRGRLPSFKGRLPAGDVSRLSMRALGSGNPLTSAEIVDLIADERSLTFASRQDREDFASSVAMALRRYERRGLVASESIPGTNKLRWALRRG